MARSAPLASTSRQAMRLRIAGVVLLLFLLARRNMMSSRAARRPVILVSHRAPEPLPMSGMSEPIPGEIPSAHEPMPSPAWELGTAEPNRRPIPPLRADQLVLRRPPPRDCCSMQHAKSADPQRALTISIWCCYSDGSWAGQCGPPGWRHSWPEGFRICNNLSLEEPEPERQHAASIFVPLHTLPSKMPTAARAAT